MSTIGIVCPQNVFITGVWIMIARELSSGDPGERFIHFIIHLFFDCTRGEIDVNELVFYPDEFGLISVLLCTINNSQAVIHEDHCIE
jgi:hypothetical protein